MKGYCKICEIKLSKKSCKYCRPHYYQSLKGKNSPHWKGGKPKCKLCFKILSRYDTKKCRKCMNLGRKYSQRTKNKIKSSVLKNPRKSKIKEYNAIKTDTILGWTKWKKFRKVILKRDNYKCQLCNKKANLIHHLKFRNDFPNLCFVPTNTISLCRNCHIFVHSVTKKGKKILGKIKEV